ncbi:uncharacterized protein B0H18DRAFT_988246 [Fomitopsis serialis]|uniref:uncharacterized protein n=1 Tax=Fomitopsis serialis TaxID=139415 RepID=UPI00200844B6|nr:uncharacterized protein B0H18DRAFT_988246 [Neoantrodia serialis]KAH9931818.1 hypothetical protein B0H18DRAFT_988246 [Neoantrodia serialis]
MKALEAYAANMFAQTPFHLALMGVAAYMTHRSSTAPTPPSKDNEIVREAKPMERIFQVSGKVVGQMGSATKYMTWASAGCTAAVLLAREYPSELSTAVLQKLLPAGIGAAARIQPTPVVLAGYVLTVVGAGIRVACFRALDRFFTFQVTVKEGHQLCTRGPYSIVRHPSYTGWCIQSVGIALWSCCAGSWAREAGLLERPTGMAAACVFVGVQTYIWLCIVLRCGQEDAWLRKHFGKGWDEWARTVPYRLVPFVY